MSAYNKKQHKNVKVRRRISRLFSSMIKLRNTDCWLFGFDVGYMRWIKGPSKYHPPRLFVDDSGCNTVHCAQTRGHLKPNKSNGTKWRVYKQKHLRNRHYDTILKGIWKPVYLKIAPLSGFSIPPPVSSCLCACREAICSGNSVHLRRFLLRQKAEYLWRKYW